MTTNYELNKIVSILEYFKETLSKLIQLLKDFKSAEYGEKAAFQHQLKLQYKSLKDELKKQIKVLIQYDINNMIVNQLLPPLCVAYTLLQEVGVNRINLNSIQKVEQNVRRANDFIESYYNILME